MSIFKNQLTKKLAFSAMALALAFVMSYIKIFDLPMGGSVTLFSMLFVCLVGYWYGLKVGLVAAFAYGLLQFIQEPYILSIPQVLIDYTLAFGALGLSGLFFKHRHGLMLGYIAGVCGRFVFSFIAGLTFYGAYAPEGMQVWVYSLVYNGSYLGAEMAITVAILFVPAVMTAMKKIKALATE